MDEMRRYGVIRVIRRHDRQDSGGEEWARVRPAFVSPVRICSRTACKEPAVFTLTYVYRDSTAVLGPLAADVEPHCYDLCTRHAARLTAPMGWELVRLPAEEGSPSTD